MGLVDALLIVLTSTLACLTLPKLLHILLTPKPKSTRSLRKFKKLKHEITSFPYCTSYSLTGTPSCKFSPNFCAKCST